ncbi:C-type lectin domain family 10 member A-like isoform X2 [Hyalella azteca]|uniref:C-type lectin domain family 10 member A-like isoform X2 n=1 Tax=Hyalella azteca TaxID=294128 RepID=A0A8B7NV16_HYAAZ|nr:C-type lectin domain family 10 member A-like isoform X2 [Hyalella azteca]
MFPSTIICLLLLIIGAVAANCPEGYEVVGSKCILRYTGGYLTYDEAATYCTQHFGRLPVLKDCASFLDVTSYVNDGYTSDFNNSYWLGATNGTLTNVWQWSDGAAVQMGAPYWARNAEENLETEPSGGTRQNCAFVADDTDWLFRDIECTASFNPLCSRPSVNGLCVHPFVLVGTQCVHISTIIYPWHEARNQCGLVGGDLIVFDDCDQYHKVALYLNEQEHNAYWIGGSDEAEEGQWRWVDGSPMTMGLPYWAQAVFGEVEPDNPGKQNCLELNCAWMYRFSSAWCSDARRVICEADPI